MSERYSEIGGALIREDPALEHLRGAEVTICFLASDLAKRSRGKAVYGQCEKVPDRNKWAMPCDFTVTVYEPNTAHMDDEHIRRLLLHELLHVGVGAGKDGTPSFSVIPHDLEDFELLVERYGTDWAVA